MKNQEFQISVAELNAATTASTAHEINLRLDIVRTNNNGVPTTENWYPKQIWIINDSGVDLKWLTLSEHELTDYVNNPSYYDFILVKNFAEAESKPAAKTEKLLIYNTTALSATDPILVYGINYYKQGQSA